MMILIGWLPGNSLSPTDDILLRLSVEILLTKWKRIESMEKLCNVVDPKFYQFLFGFDCHGRICLLVVLGTTKLYVWKINLIALDDDLLR